MNAAFGAVVTGQMGYRRASKQHVVFAAIFFTSMLYFVLSLLQPREINESLDMNIIREM